MSRLKPDELNLLLNHTLSGMMLAAEYVYGPGRGSKKRAAVSGATDALVGSRVNSRTFRNALEEAHGRLVKDGAYAAVNEERRQQNSAAEAVVPEQQQQLAQQPKSGSGESSEELQHLIRIRELAIKDLGNAPLENRVTAAAEIAKLDKQIESLFPKAEGPDQGGKTRQENGQTDETDADGPKRESSDSDIAGAQSTADAESTQMITGSASSAETPQPPQPETKNAKGTTGSTSRNKSKGK